MKRNAMRRNLRQSILRSLGRYIAIVAIIALGASMFVGLLMTKSDMIITGQNYMDEQNMFDLRLLSSYGWTQEHVDAVTQMEGVTGAEGLQYVDLIVRLGESEADSVYRFYSMPEEINRLALWGGRMPEAPDECLADGFHTDDSILGTTVTISENNSKDSLEAMAYKTYTVVGYVSTPLYMDMNRGTTTVGSGSLSSYFYIPRESMDLDYFTEINVTISGDYDIYTEEYNSAMEAMAEKLKPLLEPFADQRAVQVKEEAEAAYADGLKEYEDGLAEFQQGKEDAKRELEDAEKQLEDAEKQIAYNEQLLIDGEAQLADAKATLAEGEAKLKESLEQFEKTKEFAYSQLDSSQEVLDSNYETITSQIEELDSKIHPIVAERDALNSSIAQQEAELNALNEQIAQLDGSIAAVNLNIQATQLTLEALQRLPGVDAGVIAQLEDRLQKLNEERSGYESRRTELEAQRAPYLEQLEEPIAKRDELNAQIRELETEKRLLGFSLDAVETSLQTLEESRAALDEQFASAETEIEAGKAELEDGRQQIAQSERQLADGKAALEEAKKELQEGWNEYEEGKAEAEKEIAEAEQKLADAKLELEDARKTIDNMGDPKVYVLDRNSNIGYNSLDSSSDIVSGVSRVFPAFFLLVAALVCITTMTRMIDEERTQIGTLKALGYSNGAIISKYLLYAGSGAVVGCGLGVLVGSVVFPKILWQAYKIMLCITPDVVITFNWMLCAVVVGAYTVVMLLVTWYCCRRTLKEEPAELIRPKAPTAGKKILMEYLPFWHKISFLNKVTIRNIFRYRQRLAMMMVGIGGCTALLVTGFGLRDSIVNVVDYQFEEVTIYDISVYFTDGQTEQERTDFLSELHGEAENAMFYHQSSIELDYEDQTKEIYMISGDERICEFIDLHTGNAELSMPGMNEVLLSVGVAEAMGIKVGDEILLRDADMRMLNLTVSGIYDNHVYNYSIVAPETIEAQWGQRPEEQMAFIQMAEGEDAHELSAHISGLNDVMNVSVSEDTANMVGSMMDALDLVVIVVVVCAGLLAAIVLYNLTNININERLREIATIKVLGFHAGETAMYVFKENLTLTVVGSIFGLGLGYLLLIFVMSQIKIDMVWFKALVMPISYVWAILLTILSALAVDFIFYFKLDKINMAEALKSVE